MTKILFFIPRLAEGGAEKVLCNLVNNMDLNKFDVTVQTVDHCDSKKYLVNGVKYKSIFGKKSLLPAKIRNLWYRICTEFKWTYPLYIKDDYDVEVAYLECGATKVIAGSTNKKASKYAWVHCDLSKKDGMLESAQKVRKYYKQYDQIICVSESVREGFHKLYGKDFDTCVLYNVIDEEEIYSLSTKESKFKLDDSCMQLLAVGRLSIQKNFAYLIQSCARLKEEKYKFHLTILGEGPEKENLEQLIKDLDMESEITLYGFVENPYPWIKNADLLVCSSLYEGISTVVQEALILGTPTVTTPCTGMKELLGNSEYGHIVSDSKDGLYNGLKKIFDDHNYYINLIAKAQEKGQTIKKAFAVEQCEHLFE